MNRYRHYSEEWLLNSGAYGEHVSAMTREKLDSKSDIASELAWRDDQLAKANERADKAEKEVDRLRSLFHKWKQEKDNAVWESHIVFESLLSEMQVCPKSEDGSSNKAWWKKYVQQAISTFAAQQKVDALDKLVETVETACDKHDVPIQGYPHNKAMQRTMLNIFRKAKDTMSAQLQKEHGA